ncbi:MAG: hypothetical protein KGZ61_01335 [Sandarakinorhabdus sp.]|nr:hypothetical protein [Sandarakinorhabdus sp.]
MTDTLMSWAGALAALVSFALIGGGLRLWNRDRKRSLLMLLAAAVTLLNLYSWSTLPDSPREPARVTQPPAG